MKIKFCLFILITGLSLKAFAGISAPPDTITPEQRFKDAQNFAFSGKREEARKECMFILKERPEYHDARVLMGRTYAWDKMYDAARREFKTVIARKLDYKDAINALIDVENWDNRTDSVLFYCNYGLSFYPNDEHYLLKKAEALIKLGEKEKAEYVLRQLLSINPSDEDAIKLKKQLKSAWSDRKISIQHSFEFYKVPWIRRWHVTSVEFSQRTPFGSIIPRINSGDLVKDSETLWQNENSLQFEIDLYPRISKFNYAYLNYGFSSMGLFPKNRAGLEIYQKLPKSFEASLGMRYMQFAGDSALKNVYIFTASFGKYYKNWWFSFRPFLTPKSSAISQSYNLFIRKYLKNADNYITLIAGTGNSPDDPVNNNGDIIQYQFKSYKIKAEYQNPAFEKWIWNVRLGYGYEEYSASTFRHTFDISAKLSYLF